MVLPPGTTPMDDPADIRVGEKTGSYGRITIKRYDAKTFSLFGTAWEQASKQAKLAAVRAYEPLSVQHYRNTATRGQHELIVDHLDREQSPEETAAYLAVGDDNSTSASSSDTSLNNETYRTTVTDSRDIGTELKLTTFLGATEANSADAIREVGLFSAANQGEGHMLNHSLVDPEPKSSEVSVTVTVTLGYRAV